MKLVSNELIEEYNIIELTDYQLKCLYCIYLYFQLFKNNDRIKIFKEFEKKKIYLEYIKDNDEAENRALLLTSTRYFKILGSQTIKVYQIKNRFKATFKENAEFELFKVAFWDCLEQVNESTDMNIYPNKYILNFGVV